MCGISGVYSFKNKTFRNEVKKMNECQSSRGPDDKGLESFDSLTFGHRRLSILDLTDAGHQPMTYKHLKITYNGEIYNFREIREELKKKGYEFSTETDTEVIIKGYDKWGIDVIHKFRGMFAFALWDGSKKKLFLVRDRFGIKPLYYYKDEDKLLFSSTVKAIKESGPVSDIEEKKSWIGFFLLGSIPSPYTTIKDVFSLKPGTYLEIGEDKKVKEIKYYNLLKFFKEKRKATFEDAVRETKKLLYESIKYRLISDAPLGVFLSGGLDSSAIAGIASKLRDNPVTTLSIYFDEEEYSEREYQKIVSERIKSNHNEKKITKNNFLDKLEDTFITMDQPTVDGINTYFVSQSAKEVGLKAVLSGLGADEIFAGYPSFRKIGFLRKIQKLPKIIKLPLKLTKLFNNRLAKLSYLYNNSPIYLYLTIRGLFTPNKIANILNLKEKDIFNFIKEISREYKDVESLNPVDLLSFFEINFYLQNQLLKDTDFMSMRHSVEVRVPFLDHKLVEYISSIPSELKLHGKYNKSILIETVKDLIPSQVYDRPKMGFTFPFQDWLPEENKVKNHWSKDWARIIFKKLI